MRTVAEGLAQSQSTAANSQLSETAVSLWVLELPLENPWWNIEMCLEWVKKGKNGIDFYYLNNASRDEWI